VHECSASITLYRASARSRATRSAEIREIELIKIKTYESEKNKGRTLKIQVSNLEHFDCALIISCTLVAADNSILDVYMGRAVTKMHGTINDHI